MEQQVELIPFDDRFAEDLISWVPDREAMISFAGTSLKWPLTKGQLAELSQKPECRSFFLLGKNSPVAYGDYMMDQAGEARLCRLIVSPEHRRKGYGKVLVKKLIHKVETNEQELGISLFVLEANKTAYQCYHSCGFRENGFRIDMEDGDRKIPVVKMIYHAC